MSKYLNKIPILFLAVILLSLGGCKKEKDEEGGPAPGGVTCTIPAWASALTSNNLSGSGIDGVISSFSTTNVTFLLDPLAGSDQFTSDAFSATYNMNLVLHSSELNSAIRSATTDNPKCGTIDLMPQSGFAGVPTQNKSIFVQLLNPSTGAVAFAMTPGILNAQPKMVYFTNGINTAIEFTSLPMQQPGVSAGADLFDAKLFDSNGTSQ
ncbi:MAG TPA: hypothetical protein VJL87_04515 [Bdellovibrionota bacterium]|nr:hypothetical protein [Bdellovibrionota bacterium]